LIDRIRRTEENRSNTQPAGEQPFGEVQLGSAECRRDVADVGMGKSMVPDLVAFAINATGDVREFIRLDTDQEKSRRSIFFFQDIQNLGGPFRVGSIVEGERDLVGAVA